MNKHTQIRHAVLAKLESLSGSSAMLHDGLPVFIEPEELPALAVWLTDAQFAGQMLDESDWEAVLHVAVSGVTVAPASATVAVGATTTLTFTVKPDNASDKTLQVATADPLIATVTLKDNVATVKGVKAGSVNIVGISSDGSLVAVAAVTVTAS
ncbi:hypothetical protein B9925_13985 [Salmonella enterica]|nr:hypothetical protein [Salmonella enterica]